MAATVIYPQETKDASTTQKGVVMVDGTTITVTNGVISAVGTGGPRWEVRTDSSGKRRLAIVIPGGSDE